MMAEIRFYREKNDTKPFRAFAHDGSADATALLEKHVPADRRRTCPHTGRLTIMIDLGLKTYWAPVDIGDYICLWPNGNFGVHEREYFVDEYESLPENRQPRELKSAHDDARRVRALECNLDDRDSLVDALVGLQSTDDPALVPLHDLLARRLVVLDARGKTNG